MYAKLIPSMLKIGSQSPFASLTLRQKSSGVFFIKSDRKSRFMMESPRADRMNIWDIIFYANLFYDYYNFPSPLPHHPPIQSLIPESWPCFNMVESAYVTYVDCNKYIYIMANNENNTTYSQKRAKQLLEHHDQVARIFHLNNFYENNQINVKKLKEKISDAKKKLLHEREPYSKRNLSVLSTGEELNEYRNVALAHQKVKRSITRATQHRSKIHINNSKQEKTVKIPRLATDLGDYEIHRKKSYSKMGANHDDVISYKTKTNPVNESRRHFRMVSVESPAQHSRSVVSVEIEHKKIVLGQKQQVKQLEMKIGVLWQLYELLVEMMQEMAKSQTVNEDLVLQYIKEVSSQKFQFVHEMCELFAETRVERFIRLSRILQNFSVFEMCLNSVPKRKANSTQVINYLGYSSSSIIFLIKLLLLTHETSFSFSEHISSIISSIVRFQITSYKAEIRSIKDLLRRLEHNNEIIGMIKTRCGKKHGKYCEQFIHKITKSVEKLRTPFYECANNIFQFLSFYLHHENISGSLPLLSTPPTPFLSLAYSRTIIIDPWCVLANRKNSKLVIRAHAGKFLAQISDSCNIIFWTEFMPKDAEILTNLFPVKDNIYWLYRYHCRQQKQIMVKLIDYVGCITENTIIIDSLAEHFAYNQDIGITMLWKGEKKDTKLLNLSEIIQHIFAQATANKTTLREELQKVKPQLEKLNNMKKIHSRPIRHQNR